MQDREAIKKIFRMLGAEKIVEGETYIQGNCPFAEKLHQKKTDRHPSFGISVADTSVFHCFTCGVKGQLKKLPSALSKVYGKQFKELQDFINKNEKPKIRKPKIRKKTGLETIPNYVINAFPPINQKWRGIPLEILEKFDIRKYNEYIIFPIKSIYNETIGLKFRCGKDYLVYGNYKKYGLFFGMQFYDSSAPLYIVEGERDVMVLHTIGITNVFGLSGRLSTKQVEVLKSISNPVILFLDNDPTGWNMSATLKKELKNATVIGNYFGCKDPAQLWEENLLEKSLETIEKHRIILTSQT